MKNPNSTKTVMVVSLSRGLLTQPYQIDKLEKNLKSFGLNVKYSKNAKCGVKELNDNTDGPKLRAEDLKEAFADKETSIVLCSIGGDDTFRTLPYLLEDQEFIKLVKEYPKSFLGYSDSTVNHLMFYKLGLDTFYGISGLNDFAEFAEKMLPYTEEQFRYFLNNKRPLVLKSSPIWYEERKVFDISQLGTNRISHTEKIGFDFIKGNSIVEGKLLGGCFESLYSILVNDNYKDIENYCTKYNLFPSKEQWKDKIIFLETCEECISPNKFEEILLLFDNQGMFENAKAVIWGKPFNNIYYAEYKAIILKILSKYPKLIIVLNMNFGHCYPHCILQYNATMKIDCIHKNIEIL